MNSVVRFSIMAAWAALVVIQGYTQSDSGVPQLRKQGTATQLIVDGRPFLALAGELGNNTATSLENMQPIWPKLVSGNLNCVLVAISWAQMEPTEGRSEERRVGSDGSSDVCSSDLQHRDQSREHAADMAQTGFGQSQLRVGSHIVGADGANRGQIGRASCRE